MRDQLDQGDHAGSGAASEGASSGIRGATGYRYFTISVSNIEEVAAACTSKGYNVVMPVRELRPGITIAIAEDPDGNWVEFLQTS